MNKRMYQIPNTANAGSKYSKLVIEFVESFISTKLQDRAQCPSVVAPYAGFSNP
jgi:hypothetical protein